MNSEINSFRDLQVYKAAFDFQQDIFWLSTHWPKEESYSLIDQVRRSSRSIGSNISEAWAKRRYPAHFLSKLTDADGELQETRHWIATSLSCAYLKKAEEERLESASAEIGKMLGSMIVKHESFCYRS